jgi:quinol monooxygenase YgiN
MAKILFEVDARVRAALYTKLEEQKHVRATHGEISFSMSIDDNARHISYVFLNWESLASAQNFLESAASREIVDQWPIEEVFRAIPLREFPEE